MSEYELKDDEGVALETYGLPRYNCHKSVWAGEITKLEASEEGAYLSMFHEGVIEIHVDSEFCIRHNPRVGGYLVIYDDGYMSYSPKEAFESGYTME